MSSIAEKTLIKTEQKVQLVEGEFTTSEASFVINSLLEEKINFHKLQRLSVCEGDENSNTAYTDQRIIELQNEKIIAKEYIDIARKEGYNVFINGTLEITFTRE